MVAGDFTAQTRISEITGCKDESDRFSGIQITLKDGEGSLIELQSIGVIQRSNSQNCETVPISDSDQVKELKLGWDSAGISSISFITSEGTNAIFGSEQSETKTIKFKDETKLTGLFG